MKNLRLKRMILAALLAAMTCAATAAIRIPTPSTGGYIHAGDAVVILSGILLGPIWGALAAGIGSALADIMGGYLIYAPITLIIKGAVAAVTGICCKFLRKRNKGGYLFTVMGGIADILLVGGGYFLFEIPLYGIAAAALSIPSNLLQGAGGLMIATLLYPVISAIPDVISDGK